MKLNVAVIIDQSKILKTIDGFQKAFDDALFETGLRIERDTKNIMTREYNPDIVDTGRLRSSIHVERAGEKVTINGATVYGRSYTYQHTQPGASNDGTMVDVTVGPGEVIIGTNVEYAAFHEFGTRKLPARPYLGLAFKRNRNYFQARLKKNAKRVAP